MPSEYRYTAPLFHLAHIVCEGRKWNRFAVGQIPFFYVADVPAEYGRIIAAHRFYIRAPLVQKPVVTIGQSVLMPEHDTSLYVLLQFEV